MIESHSRSHLRSCIAAAGRRVAVGAGLLLTVLGPSAGFAQPAALPPQPLALNDTGVVLALNSVVYRDRSVPLLGPYGKHHKTTLIAVNNRGQVLLEQLANGPHFFRYDPAHGDMRPIGLNAQVQEGGVVRSVRLGYLTGLDDSGRVFGVYGSGKGPCGAAGAPAYGAPGEINAPTQPAKFAFLGCPGRGLHIRAINSKGQMTGDVNRQGFLWSNGALSLFRFPGAVMTQGVAINESGLIAGVIYVTNAIRADGTVTSTFLRGVAPPQKGFTYDGSRFRLLFMQRWNPVWVTGVNNRGQIVGYSDPGEDHFKGFIIDSATLPVAHTVR